MAGSMKEIKSRIKSVESTMQITKAMELVASSKLRRAKERAENSRPYFTTLRQTLNDIVESNTEFTSPYTQTREVKRTCYVVIAGDRGLAGGYNSNVFRMMTYRMGSRDALLVPVGRKAMEFASRSGKKVLTHQFEVAADLSVSDCFAMARLLCDGFRGGDFDEVYVGYTNFVSMLKQEPELLALLPLKKKSDIYGNIGFEYLGDKAPKRVKPAGPLTLYEPDSETVFNTIVPEYVAGLIYGALCESIASEQAARRTAMDAASKNASEMIETLNLNYNRARQAAITQEITEIIGGANG